MSAVTEKYSSPDAPIAEAAISAKKGYAVKAGSAAHSVDIAAAADQVRGIIVENGDFAIGEAVPVANQPGDLVAAVAGNTVAIGDKVTADSAGKLVPVTTPGAKYYGIAETGASTSGVFSLRIEPGVIPFPTMAQDTTTAGGEITISGMTSAGKVLISMGEAPGTNLVLSHAICATGKITVYTKNTNTDAEAVLNAKKVNYLVIAY